MSNSAVPPSSSVVAPRPDPRFKRIHIIVNPASGQDRPVLGILNDAFHESGVEWEVFVTKESGDGQRYARAAIEAQVDAVAVYGGDGTVGEVASALVGSDVPLAIFPGGTANVMTVELGIPSDPALACALVSRGTGIVRAIDVGRVGDQYFLTRIGMGLEANVIAQTDRAQKDRMGWLAYALNGLRELADPKVSHYTLTIDGEQFETDGLLCMVANSGIFSPNSGLPGRAGLSVAPSVSISDGVLDLLVIRSGDLPSLLQMAASIVAHTENAPALQHWQGHTVHIEADPPQTIQLDGEVVGQTPVSAEIVPLALKVIVPADAESPTATQASFDQQPPVEVT
jgi:YegS/Rv2252/BmrU family lipid kinase